MSAEKLFEEVAAWALQHGRFVTSRQLCDEFDISLAAAGRIIRMFITHPRITAEFKREKCIVNDAQTMSMVMVRVVKVARVPLGPPKPAKLPKPPKLKVVVLPQPKDEVVLKKLRKLVANMPR
ncbi:hypothetical protein JFQ93_001487 [Aeromonas sobria]|jgi:hypothetical protein|nr:hypothetical protein [Aeromonas sobria]